MCQLLGMNCSAPTDFNFSFRGFCRRGGDTDIHSHGWGMGIYEGNGLREFKDKEPASQSLIAKFLTEQYQIKSFNIIAHIRYATQGEVAFENVHPFSRELWGITWCFAHNGEVPKYNDTTPYTQYPMIGRCSNRHSDIFYHPIGNTDSEATFCMILNALRAEFTELPTLPLLYETLQRLCSQLVEGEEDTTILNFLLGCGPYTLFAYSWPGARPGSKVWNGLHYTVRTPPFATETTLIDCDYSIDFSKVAGPNDRVAVIATKPLTSNEEWKEFRRGELLMFDYGLAYHELYDCREIEQQGRGLFSHTVSKKQTTKNAINNSSPTTASSSPSPIVNNYTINNNNSINSDSSNKRLRISSSMNDLSINTPPSTATTAASAFGGRHRHGYSDGGGFLPCSPRHHDIPSELRGLVNKEITTNRKKSCYKWAKNGVDVGCGTGNSGVAFRSCVSGSLTGVDLSPAMIDQAKQRKNCYDDVLVGNVECVLRKQPTQGNKRCTNKCHGALTTTTYDLIFACGVFVYIKDLRNVFFDIRQILSKDGIFAFSAEFFDDKNDNNKNEDTDTSDDDDSEHDNDDVTMMRSSNNNNSNKIKGATKTTSTPYELQSCARYAHKRWYLEESAKEFGFVTKAFRATPLHRKHNGHEVYGCLVVLTI